VKPVRPCFRNREFMLKFCDATSRRGERDIVRLL
jgi:hypothetical protein